MDNNSLLKVSYLLIAGLLIGSIGTYSYLNNMSQTNTQQMTKQLQILNETITEQNSIIATAINKITELQTTLDEQEQQLTKSRTDIDDLLLQISSINQKISLIEDKYGILSQENNGNIVEIRELKEKISGLYEELGLPTGYVLYLAHDIRFEYPERMNVTESGFITSYPMSGDGVFIGSIVEKDYVEVMSTQWLHDGSGYLRDNIQDWLDALNGLASQGLGNVQVGELQTSTHLGHTVFFKEFSASSSERVIHGVEAVWYCPVKDRGHMVIVYTDSADYKDVFQSYLGGFRCHK